MVDFDLFQRKRHTHTHITSHYKDQLRLHLKASEILTSDWESSATDRSNWRKDCSNFIHSFEEARLDWMKVCWQKREEVTSTTVNPLWSTYTCNTCGCICHSRIRDCTHAKCHQGDLSCRWLRPLLLVYNKMLLSLTVNISKLPLFPTGASGFLFQLQWRILIWTRGELLWGFNRA